MARKGLTESELEDRFYECVKGTGRGLTYGPLVKRYAKGFHLTERSAKTHLKLLLNGVMAGRLTSVARYRGPEGWLYGSPADDNFLQAKEDSERPVVIERPPATVNLGGVFNDSPVRSEWTKCPETNRIVKSTIITMGVADFMECLVCCRAHFLGVNPKMMNQRLYAWQIDPLVNAEDYSDWITVDMIGDSKFRGQSTRIERIRQGGCYKGLWFRRSWDKDPNDVMAKAMQGSGKPGKSRKGKLIPNHVAKEPRKGSGRPRKSRKGWSVPLRVAPRRKGSEGAE